MEVSETHFAAAVLTALLVQTTSALAAGIADPSHSVFQYSLKDGRGVTDAGTLGRSVGVQVFQNMYNNFIFDVANGTLSVQGQTTYWTITRPGDGADDLIAQLPGVDPPYNVMRISAWDDPIRVSMTDGMEIYSGLCDRIR